MTSIASVHPHTVEKEPSSDSSDQLFVCNQLTQQVLAGYDN